MRPDILILGGGSAGCVLAARLSEDPDRRVVLVEAGRDISSETMPPEIRSRYPGRAYLDVRNIWAGLTARMGASPGNRDDRMPRRYEQARLLGGGSAINALMANRGAPADYDEWEALGADGWAWEDCLPYFRKLESDRDFAGPLHGTDGPILVRRAPPERLSPFVQRVMQVLDARGHPIRPDQNGDWEDGTYVGAIAASDDGTRIPTSVAYLTSAVRARPNLSIRTDHLVERILFAGNRAVGARIAPTDGGPAETILAGEIVVASGAIHSPALLLRSGVGPGADLACLGIPLVAERPGVGRNLMEHPSIAVSAVLSKAGRTPCPDEHHEQAIWRFSSGLAGTPSGDMHGAILSRSGWHSVGLRLGTIFFWVNKSHSRGELALATPDPRAEPAIDFRMLSDPRDRERLKLAVRRGAEVLLDPAMADLCRHVFPTSYSPRVARVAVSGRWNALQRGALSASLDLSGPLVGALITSVVTQGLTLGALLDDDAALDDFVMRSVGGTWHPSGTCRMGRATDRLAVTDAQGRVHGTQALRVCDASLMPTIPRANTNVPTIMIAERIADVMRS
ncbi:MULTISPECIES: GMC family oxidoreductase [unclassified Aureimonas]|uniref:GMC family oxidoreductase n=1 Tax=unclassified Aureimonas TaxID=2615206 RepID=UPI0006F8FC7B|nr:MULTISPECIES: GMC family oxidoreductase N-terminal domain-containing protein [unclassified Aureimonas]KQT68954.1 sorbosone dehydrogenase [Aureimonas sp. Leaf460]KQT69182.1 sorbosone dehydrogenase [Aureimonas sp. Leaf427]